MANLRREARKNTLAKWKAQGPALIAKPLKAVRAAFPDIRENGRFVSEDPVYAEARRAAQRGDGKKVKQMARDIPAHLS